MIIALQKLQPEKSRLVKNPKINLINNAKILDK